MSSNIKCFQSWTAPAAASLLIKFGSAFIVRRDAALVDGRRKNGRISAQSADPLRPIRSSDKIQLTCRRIGHEESAPDEIRLIINWLTRSNPL